MSRSSMAITEFQQVLKARQLHSAGQAVNFPTAHTSGAEKFRMKRFSALLAGLIGSVQIAAAQDYPTRPITLIVPLAAGGGADIVSRIVTERMRVSLGQPIVVENIPAAAGTVALT